MHFITKRSRLAGDFIQIVWLGNYFLQPKVRILLISLNFFEVLLIKFGNRFGEVIFIVYTFAILRGSFVPRKHQEALLFVLFSDPYFLIQLFWDRRSYEQVLECIVSYFENILRSSFFLFVLIKGFQLQGILPLLTIKFVHFRRFLCTKLWVDLGESLQLIEIINSFNAQHNHISFAKSLSITYQQIFRVYFFAED